MEPYWYTAWGRPQADTYPARSPPPTPNVSSTHPGTYPYVLIVEYFLL
ncbi:hypothetical protein [Hymenobacter sp. HDW8]|nr:hypothetical protein [Hymenobacter sp. HDW8]QIL76102.1 hypothetical protein G7064_09725 [Hymenobacter sp. HDW8]